MKSTYIIGEIGQNHNGSVDIAKLIVEPPAKPNANDLLISLFRDVMDTYPEYKEYIPTVTEEIIDAVIEKINMKVKAKEIKEYVLARYNLIVN